MGGGVSLGTFSGAALTESLKLLLLFGRDGDGNEYSGIEVDSMSGASAGSIALAIMLRALLDYKSVLGRADYNSKGEVIKDLEKQYPILVANSKQRRKLEDLIALQVAQKLQEKIWVNDLTIDKLIDGTLSRDPNPDEAFGLLDRDQISKMVERYFYTNIENISQDTLRVVNKERFLFACSLSNLTPIQSPAVMNRYRETEAYAGRPYTHVKNLLTSVSSFEHAEVRVIDFVFKDLVDDKKSDKRWLTFGNKEIIDNLDEQIKFDIKDTASWKVLAASAIACGAFPVGFQPLLLKRYKQEFGGSWPNKFDNLNKQISKDEVMNKSYIDGGIKLDYSSFNFAYVDGGTFNNEPIKEAFKLAYFQDFHDPKSEENDYDRIVLFVDPIVRTSDPLFQQSTYHSITSKLKDNKTQYKENSEFSKLFSVVSSLIGMLNRQGSIKEEHKVDRFIENQILNNQLQMYLANSGTRYDDGNNTLFETSVAKIEHYLKSGIIPSGTRKIEVYLSRLTNRFAQDAVGNKKFIFKNIKGTSSENIKNLIDALKVNEYDLKKSLGLIPPIKTGIGNTDQKILNDFLQLFLLALGDVGLNTLGKDSSAVRVGITPHNIETDKVVKLPGTEMFAFGGFMDRKTREYGFQYGRLCAHNILENNQFRQYHEDTTRDLTANPNDKLFQYIDGTTEEVREAKELTMASVTSLNYYVNHLDNYSDSLFKTGFKKIVARVNNMYSIGFFKGILAGIGLTFGSITSIFTDKFFKYMVKAVARQGLGINNMKIEKSFKPIKIQIEIDSVYLVNLHYNTTGTDKKEELNFIKRKKDDKKIIEFQLFLDTDKLISNNKLRILPFASLPYQKIDPNFEKSKAYGDPIKKLFVTSSLNRINRGVKHVIDLESLINNDKESIFYSVQALDYHINPMLKLVPYNNGKCEVTFEEGTTAFELEI